MKSLNNYGVKFAESPFSKILTFIALKMRSAFANHILFFKTFYIIISILPRDTKKIIHAEKKEKQ